MDREQFLEQLAAPAGGKENIGLCDFRSGCLSVTVKDRSVIDLNAIRGLPGVADAELLRSRLRITLDQTIMEELQMAKKEDYGALAKQILSLVGGAENVSNATHCATRLRFNRCHQGPGRCCGRCSGKRPVSGDYWCRGHAGVREAQRDAGHRPCRRSPRS